jgi:hypothetical protein
MSKIFQNYFQEAYTLKCLLFKLNVDDKDSKEIQCVLNSLSKVIVTFDYEIPDLKYTADKRFSYEQVLCQCFVKINELKLSMYRGHMFKQFNAKLNSRDFINLNDEQIRDKLLAVENMSLSYFLSNWPQDGFHWKRLHALVGNDLFRCLLMFSCIFRRLQNTDETYVQICGVQFNQVCQKAVSRLLTVEDVSRPTPYTHTKQF